MQQSKNLDADKLTAIADGAGGILEAIPLAGEAEAGFVGGIENAMTLRY